MKRKIGYALLGVLVGILIVLVIVRVAQTAQLVNEIREAQVTNGKTLDNSSETLHVIKDCTQPTGACYKHAQRETAGAVASINRVVILAAACASQKPGQSVAEIQRCVINRLAAHKR